MSDVAWLLALDSVEDLKAAFNGDIGATEAALCAAERKLETATVNLRAAMDST